MKEKISWEKEGKGTQAGRMGVWMGTGAVWVISRSRVEVWGWKAGRGRGWPLEEAAAKELIGQWFNGPHGKTQTNVNIFNG